MGTVAVLGEIWEIVFLCELSELARSAASVSREMPGFTAGNPGRLRHRRTGTRLQPELARRPYGPEMITRLEHVSEPRRREPGHVFHHG